MDFCWAGGWLIGDFWCFMFYSMFGRCLDVLVPSFLSWAPLTLAFGNRGSIWLW